MKKFYIAAVKIKKSVKEVIKAGDPEPGMVAHSQHWKVEAEELGVRSCSSLWSRLHDCGKSKIKEAARTPSLLPCIIFLQEVKQAVRLVSHLCLCTLHGCVCACV